jgi:hypothetical protein
VSLHGEIGSAGEQLPFHDHVPCSILGDDAYAVDLISHRAPMGVTLESTARVVGEHGKKGRWLRHSAAPPTFNFEPDDLMRLKMLEGTQGKRALRREQVQRNVLWRDRSGELPRVRFP